MIPVTPFAGKTVAVFGLGGSGLASAQALVAGGAEVVAFDDSAASLRQGRSGGHRHRRPAHARLVEDRGAAAGARRAADPSRAALVGRAGARGQGRGDRRHRAVLAASGGRLAPHSPFVAITGTNGKSTTTALIHHLLDAAGRSAELGGNIGTAVLTLQPPRPDHAHVIECSSYQIDLAPTLDPRVGILINVSADHLDRHGTLAHYAAVKERLVAGVQRDGTAVIGVDDEWCAAAAERVAARAGPSIRISVRRRLPDGVFVENGRRSSARPPARPRPSRRSTASARCAGCTTPRTPPARPRRRSRSVSTPRRSRTGLRSFPGLAHRMEQVGRKGAVLFVNDSKATNADSAAQALASLHRHVLDCRRQAEDRRHRLARKILPAHPQGLSDRRGGGRFRPHARRQGRLPRSLGTLERAVEAAARDAEASGLKEPVVLLSPACASFDQYRNFEVRGDRFRDLVWRCRGLSRPVAA